MERRISVILIFRSYLKMEKMSYTFSQQYEEKIRPCIDTIDRLRSLGVEKDLALPAIAVIGDQSSGKSSVLEALSGVALPRGSGKDKKYIYIITYKYIRSSQCCGCTMAE